MEEVREKSMRYNKHHGQAAGPAGFVFFVAWIGAAVYFVNQVDGFWNIVLAVLKSFVWPGYLVYHVLGLLHIS